VGGSIRGLRTGEVPAVPQIDYYLSLNSPWAYLGAARLRALSERTGTPIKVKPLDYGGTIFPATGGLTLPKRPPARQAYRMMELKRWPAFLGVPLNSEPKHFPFNEYPAARLVVAADLAGGDPLLLSEAILRALWAEERNPGDPDTL